MLGHYWAKVYTSQSSKIVNKYDIASEFDSNMYLNMLRVLRADLQDHSIDCLIGRDVLRFGVFTWRSEWEFSFSFLNEEIDITPFLKIKSLVKQVRWSGIIF